MIDLFSEPKTAYTNKWQFPILRPYQIEASDAFLDGEGSGLIQLPVGAGKCLGKGTPILMHDGTVKPVEDVIVGDLLMGPDSQPRTVTSLARGQETLYKVNPVKGDSFVCNESHILSIKLTPDKSRPTHKMENICVKDYLQKSDYYKHSAKCWRVGVDFPENNELLLPPYILGLWLSDGSSSHFEIHKPDEEIKNAVNEYAISVNMEMKIGGNAGCTAYRVTADKTGEREFNTPLEALKLLDVRNNKHVPDIYKINSRKNRLELLAGMIDGDGSLSHSGYEFSSTIKQMADAVTFIARSLGLAAYCKQRITKCQTGATCVSWRVNISGDCSVIPCRIARKKAPPRLQKKDVLVTGFELENIGIGDYYGFSIDGPDRLFLLGDFTVTHNTITVARISYELIKRSIGKHLFLAHTKELVRQTCLAYMRFGIWPSVERGESKGQPFKPTIEEKRELFGDNFPPNDWFIFNRVIIGTYQTLINRVGKYTEDIFDLFIIDEAHRSECKSYHYITQELRARNPELRLLGLTATPKRGDSKPLTLFPKFFYRMPLTQAIDDGWAVDVRAKKCKMAGDFSDLRTISNDDGEEDFSDAELATIIRHPEVIESIALPIIEFGENRRGIVFTCGQDVSEILSDAINSILYKDVDGVEFYGILNKDTNKVKHKPFDDINSPDYTYSTFDDSWVIRPCATFVHGSVPDGIRDQRIKDFRNGKYRLIVGCQMLVEGFDVPDISLVVMARLTGSSGFYEQCLGRGLRLLKDCIKFALTRRDRLRCILESKKPDCKILDFCNNTTRHRIINAETILLGGELPEYIEYSEAVQDSEIPLRKQLDEIKSLAELREALKDFSISSNDIDFITEDVNIFGQGRLRDEGKQLRNSNAPGKTLIEKAEDFRISNPERYTAEALEAKIDTEKSKWLGKSGYKTLMTLGVTKEFIDKNKPNWNQANSLRKAYFGNKKKLPDNWQQILGVKQ